MKRTAIPLLIAALGVVYALGTYDPPDTSTESHQPGGHKVLFEWLDRSGADPIVVRDPGLADAPAGAVYVVTQAQLPDDTWAALEDLIRSGGRLVVLEGRTESPFAPSVAPLSTPPADYSDWLEWRGPQDATLFDVPVVLDFSPACFVALDAGAAREDGCVVAGATELSDGQAIWFAAGSPASNAHLSRHENSAFLTRVLTGTLAGDAASGPVVFIEPMARVVPGATRAFFTMQALILLIFAGIGFGVSRRLGPPTAPARPLGSDGMAPLQHQAESHVVAGHQDVARQRLQHYADRLGVASNGGLLEIAERIASHRNSP